ncbi:alpha/beta hydrolase [Granulicoccus sp. GXG6511]|uniref:alpha/beta hydrolase n=1 Tax=Granulicoccus sp. GXG6511 TaxID=3381351 RepID=UPI003D7EF816
MTTATPSPAAIAAWREDNAARKRALGPGPDMAATRELSLTVPDAAPVRARFLVPTDRPAGVLVYLHGGGWVTGSIDTFDRLGRELARRTGWAVLLVDYAKAPERPFPAGVEDAWAAWQWAVQHADDELGSLGTTLADGFGLVVGGDSSGGNLATVVARRARDAGVRLDGQILVYPVTDCDPDRPSYRAAPDSRSHIQLIWDLYCPAELRTGPDASPLRAESLAGLAPALILDAEHDALNSEIDAYAERLTAEGVELARHHLPGVEHGCLSYWDTVPAAGRALDAIRDWLALLVR